jgi:TolB protein
VVGGAPLDVAPLDAGLRPEEDGRCGAADGGEVRVLSTRSPKEIWLSPAWSPKKLLLVAGVLSLTDNKARLVEVSIDDGKEKYLDADPWLSMSSLVWLVDGSGLVLTGRDLETKLFQIWFVGYPDGKARRITNDLSSYAGVSLTADGKTLVSVQNQRVSSLWVAPNGNADLATKLTHETGRDEGLSGLSWTPDGRVVHTERNSGATDLWVMNHDGTNNTQLTMNAGRNFYPNVTPDGRLVVFISDRAGRNDIWRVDIDGRNPIQLTNFAPVNANPSISADSKWVLYQTVADNNPTIWKSSIDGGPPVPLAHSATSRAAASPSGDKFVCTLAEAGKSEPAKVALFSLAGGEPERILDLPNILKSGQLHWDATGQALIYREGKNRVDNLWSQTLNGGPPKQLTDFKSDQIFNFDWSRDGKNVVVARGRSGSDVVMITSFR